MGHHNIHFSGDPHSNSGAWSPPTSRANFCEEDYAISFYLAEFVNALTNVAYVYPALRSMYGRGSRGVFAPRWDFMSVSLLVLGIGSFLFHASLRLTLEFVDELSMVLLTWSMLQALLTTRQPPFRARLISVGLAVVHIAFAAFYIRSAQIIHQVYAFWTALASISLRTTYLFYGLQPALPEAKTGAWKVRIWQSVGVCILGYLIWNVDLEYCAELRALRQHIPLPWAWILELHGWWHILTAIGASMFMQVVREVREEAEREKKTE
ncbi:ceramidase [Chaetomium strumarium]|uniref:Ceramidase n=1 Tax=Chaetomium strumarium TaxID=1170767 RepID=A0AAJ0M0Q8_9PEZI|nr:ceramidase [Chaetomium strumarium]